MTGAVAAPDWFWHAVAATVIYGVFEFTYKLAARAGYSGTAIVNRAAVTVSVLAAATCWYLGTSFEPIGQIALFGFLNATCFATGTIAQIAALRDLPTSQVFPIVKLSSLLCIGLGFVFLGERPGPWQWLGIALGAGVVAVVRHEVETAAASGRAASAARGAGAGVASGRMRPAGADGAAARDGAAEADGAVRVATAGGVVPSVPGDERGRVPAAEMADAASPEVAIGATGTGMEREVGGASGPTGASGAGGGAIGRRGMALAVVGAVGVACSMFVGKLASMRVPAASYILASYSLSALYTFGIARWQAGRVTPLDWRGLGYGVFIGAMNFTGYLLLLHAFKHGPLALVQGIFSTTMAITIPLSVVGLGEPFSRRKVMAVGLALAALWLIRW